MLSVVFLEFISFRSKDELKKAAEQLARLEKRDKSDEYRMIFLTGLEQRRRNLALELYSRDEVSMGKACEIAGVSVWEFIDLMKKRGVHLNLTAEDILEQAERV